MDAIGAWADYLSSQPRMRGVVAIGDRHLAVTVDQPAGRAMRTSTVLYRRSAGGWSAVRVLPSDRGQVFDAGFGAVGWLRVDGTEHVVESLALTDLDDPRAKPRETARITGRIGAIVTARPTGTLLVATRAPDVAAFRSTEVLHTTTPHVCAAQALAGAGRWRIAAITRDGVVRDLPLALPAGCAPTGELAWLSGDRAVAGIARDTPAGGRRFGLVVLAADGSATECWLPGHDLTAPLTSPNGSRVAVLASTVPGAGAHLDHRPWLLTRELALRPIPTDPEFWDLPACWLDDTVLITLSERHSERRLVPHPVETGGGKPLTGTGSVLAATALGGTELAWISSATDAPPSLRTGTVVMPNAMTHQETVEQSDPPPPGCSARPWAVRKGTAERLFLPEMTPRGLIALFHGGPTMSWCDWSWRWNPGPFTAAGFAVALIEPPMSSGYGARSQAAGWRRWYSGIATRAAGQVDDLRTRTGLRDLPLLSMGGSFGGYLALHTAHLLDVALVAVHAAPVALDSVAYGSDAFWSWVREYGHPEFEPDEYRAQSVPLAAIPATTKVLISHGMRDEIVPWTESVRAHRVLLAHGVRSELALLRGEGHSLRNPATARDWLAWVLAASERAGAGAPSGEEVLSCDP